MERTSTLSREDVAKNQVFVLKIPGLTDDGDSEMLEETVHWSYSKPFEWTTAVRFFDKVAYAVTFRRTDPFCVLKLTDLTNPVVLGELSITGFSAQ